MAFFGKSIFKPQAPRRFNYRPMYYDVRNDSEAMQERRQKAKREGGRDPLLHGTTMYERMTGVHNTIQEPESQAWESQIIWARRAGFLVLTLVLAAALFRTF